MQVRAPEIAIQNQCAPLVLPDDRLSQVACHERLPLSWKCAGDHEGLQLLVVAHLVEARPQRAKLLRAIHRENWV
jgi:hypothetical protein